MRAFFVLLTTVVTLVVSASAVSGFNIKLQASQNLAPLTNAAADTQSSGGRMLRADATTDEFIDEERGIVDIAKKLGTKVKGLIKDQYHAIYVKLRSAAMNQDETAQLFLQKNIHPDKVKKWLGLGNEKNRIHPVTGGDSPELELFTTYQKLWNSVHKE